jgi:probable phosphomutase (TIGR03848 family)
MTDTSTRLFLVRHGYNDFVGHRLAGWMPGVHLNARGQAEVAALGERMRGVAIDAIYSSPLERAQETAAALAGDRQMAIQSLEGIGEVRCGDWTDHEIEELAKLDEWKALQQYAGGFLFPGGESMADVQARGVACIEALRRQHAGQTIAVVSHADTLKAILVYYLGMPLDFIHRLEIAPASLTELILTPHRPVLLRFNDCSHIPPQPAQVSEEKPAETENRPAAS